MQPHVLLTRFNRRVSNARIRRPAINGALASGALAAWLTVAGAAAPQDKYAVKVEGGLSFAEFRGYEHWAVISISQNGGKVAVILGNRLMIEAYRKGIPGNGQPFPDGARMAKIHWTPTRKEAYPGQPQVPGELHDVDFMVKDSKRFADSAGWGWGAFEYDSAAARFTPATEASQPPQGHDARCGLACHTVVKGRDYVFTDYGRR